MELKDLDYVRDLLLKINEADHPLMSQELLSENPDDEEHKKLVQHLSMLINETCLIAGTATSTISKIRPTLLDLTWKGYEFLDCVRDPMVWEKTKKATESSKKDSDFFNFEFVIKIAQVIVRERLEEVAGMKL